jgi:ABC-2 type transport system ATP-binding protein
MTPAIEAHGLKKRYGKTRALDGLDLVAEPGQVVAVLGPNGAGKTTFVRAVATLLRLDEGALRVAGHDVSDDPGAVRRVIGLAGQFAAVEPAMTGRENLEMVARLFGQDGRAARRSADAVLEQLGLRDDADRLARTYSGGMRRRLDLAASLIAHPSVLFLDEPTTGLDPSARALMWDIVRQLVADGTTLLLTTQYLDEADQLAGRIAVIDGGKVIAEGAPADLKASLGGQRVVLELADPEDAPVAAKALAPFATTDISPGGAQRSLEVPVAPADGLATQVLRALDAVGVSVNDIAVRTASLDDVFLTLTGHRAEEAAEEAA